MVINVIAAGPTYRTRQDDHQELLSGRQPTGLTTGLGCDVCHIGRRVVVYFQVLLIL